MKKINKVALIFAIAILILAAIFIGTSYFNASKEAGAPANDYVSRSEWIKMLSDSFGLTECLSDSEYFTDVTKEDELFPEIQSCVEWNILDKGGKFNGSKKATKEFVALTCLKAVGLDNLYFESKTLTEATKNDLLSFALSEYLIIKEDGHKWDASADLSDCSNALSVAKDLYMSIEFADESIVTLLDSVINLSDLNNNELSVSDSSVYLPNNDFSIKPGDIVITPPTQDAPGGLAKKVISVQPDGDRFILETEQPELSEVFEELTVSNTIIPQYENCFIIEEGISIREINNILGTGNDYKISTANISQSKAEFINTAEKKGLSFELDINLTKGSLDVSTEWQNLSSKASQEKGDISDPNNLPFKYDEKGRKYVEKYESGFEIVGTMKLKNLFVKNELKMKPFLTGINKLAITTNYETEIDLAIKGKAEGTQTTLCKFKCPIATGVWADIEFILEVGINGEITVKSVVTNTSALEYRQNSGFKKTNNTNYENSADFNASITTEFGPKVILVALGIDICDAQIKAGFGAELETKLAEGFTTIPCINITAYAPTLEISTGMESSSLLTKLKIKGKWVVLKKENAPFKKIYHFEVDKGFLSSCSYNDKYTAKETPENTAEGITDSTTYETPPVTTPAVPTATPTTKPTATSAATPATTPATTPAATMDNDTESRDTAHSNTVTFGEYVYSLEYDDEKGSCIYKQNKNGTEKTLLHKSIDLPGGTSLTYSDLHIYNDYLYFISYFESNWFGGSLYGIIARIKTDGTDYFEYPNANGDHLWVINGYLYYSSDGVGGGDLEVEKQGTFRINADGTDITKVSDIVALGMDSAASSVIHLKDQNYSMSNLDGSNLKPILKASSMSWNFGIVDEWIYFNTSEGRYKIKSDGTGKAKVQ